MFGFFNDQKSTHYNSLRERLEKRNSTLRDNIVTKHKEAFEWAANNTKQLAAGAMGSILLLTAPQGNLLDDPAKMTHEQFVDVPDNLFLVNDVSPYLPESVDDFSAEKEQKVSEILSQHFGMDVRPDINGMRLNHTYGIIGAEQHLMRFAGDTMEGHFSDPNDEAKYYSSGMAPGRGAYGYFANSRAELTQKEIDREKYYLAVQTFRVADYATRTREYVNFFKFRKMLVVNPNTGKAVVAVIGDAGPAVWTGKQLGGSPEVMKHLGRVDGRARGGVLYFFIDDPEDKIPLGPVEPVSAN